LGILDNNNKIEINIKQNTTRQHNINKMNRQTHKHKTRADNRAIMYVVHIIYIMYQDSFI